MSTPVGRMWTTPRWQGLILALALLVVLVPFWRAFEWPGMHMDEGMLLVYPEQVLKGKLPYRDFETYYGPGNIFVLAASYAVAGVSIDVERGVGLLYRVLLLAGIFFVARPWGLAPAISGMLLGAILLLMNGLIALAWFGGVAVLLWSLIVLGGEPSRWRAIVGGLLAAGSLLYRVDLGLALIASTIPLWLRLPVRLRWVYLGSLFVGLAPFAVLLVVVGWRSMFENLFLYPVVISNPGRRLPFSLVTDEMISILALHLGASACGIVAGFLAVRQNPASARARLLLSVALLAVGLTHQTLQRADMVHILCTVFLSIALLPMALAVLWRRGQEGALPAWGGGACAAGVLVTLVALAPPFGAIYLFGYARAFSTETTPSKVVQVRARHFRPSGSLAEIQRVLSFVERNSKPGQRLFVGTSDLRRTFANDTFIYHLLPWLTPATYFLEMNPLSANRPGSRLAADVASADWLVLNQVWDHSGEPNLSSQNGSDEPNVVVREHFQLRGRTGPFLVYCRKPELPAEAGSQ